MSSFLQACANQKRSLLLALALCLAAIWLAAPMGHWQVGVFAAVGIILSLANHVLTERTLMLSVGSGDLLTRKQYASTSLVRLLAVTLVAVALAVLFWPYGAAVFLGLALFHLITLVFTGIPLLKEIKKA